MSAWDPDEDRNSGAWIAVERYRRELVERERQFVATTGSSHATLATQIETVKECLKRIMDAGNS